MQTEAIKLIQISDPHLHAHRDACMRGVNTKDKLTAVLKHIRDNDRSPDAIVATGDLVQDETRGGYLRFQKMLRPLEVPVFCIPGNHDSPALMQELLNESPFQYCGGTRIGDWKLLFLNSHSENDDGGRFTKEQIDMLRNDLEQHDDIQTYTMLFLHHHPIDMGSRWLDGVGLRPRHEFMGLIERHMQVRGVAWGHVHQASDHNRNGVRMLSAPSPCSQFLPNSDDFAMDNRPPGYRWIYLYPDGSIETEVVWLNAEEYHR